MIKIILKKYKILIIFFSFTKFKKQTKYVLDIKFYNTNKPNWAFQISSNWQ